jgi:hypothetical protein
MEASKSEFLANLEAELDSVDETMTAPAAAWSQRPQKLGRRLFAAAFAAVAPLGLMLNAAPAAAATGLNEEPGFEIQSCSDFTSPDYVRRTHTKKCRQLLNVFVYKYSKSENNGTILCHWFEQTTIMPCAVPVTVWASACGHG